MGIKKLWTALVGAGNEVVEKIEDDQAIRILDQEMRESKAELQRCDESLTKIMAKRKLAERKVSSINEEIDTYTTHAISASENGDEALAIECAEKVSELEVDLDGEQAVLDGFLKSEKSLKANISKAKASVKSMLSQIDQVKATASVQKAQAAVSSRHTGANSKIKTAVTSLDRIKKKQSERAAELEAADELAEEESGSELEKKLKAAGLTPGGKKSGSDRLAQMLAKNKG